MRLSRRQSSLLTAVAVIAAFLIGGSFVPNFLKPANFLNVIRQCSIIAICAVGVTQVIVKIIPHKIKYIVIHLKTSQSPQ